ncbi:MAG: CpsB/CapC family capsule biosynthesis tyrosine phosphatase [Ferruginibacter sp.]|nr:histidinol phosphatase [Ferruginibacter sp.]
MFSIFKKKNTAVSSNYFPISTDIHSHILPGIDDGSPNIQTSLELITGLINLGVNKSIATPHIIGDLYKNNATTINTALKELQNAIAQNKINFEIKAAAEYMLDSYFFELLQQKAHLLTLQNNIILTEFSYADKPYNVEQMLYTIITEGYQPILAHPERYAYFHNDYKQYNHLSDIGFLLQVNILSLTGYYGKPVAKAAAYIIKNDLASFTATDLHHQRHLQALQHPQNKQIFANIFAGKTLNQEIIF